MAQQVSGLPYSAFLLPGSIAAAIVILSTARLVFPRRTPQTSPAYVGSKEAVRPDASPLALSILLSAAPILVVLLLALATPVSFPIAAAFGVLTGIFVMQPGRPYWQEVDRRFQEGAVHGIDWPVVATVAGTVFFGKTVANSPALDLAGGNVSTSLASLLVFGVVIPIVAAFADTKRPEPSFHPRILGLAGDF